MALDLSVLEEKPAFVASMALPEQPTGKPLEILLTDIEEDPDQPRKEFTAEAMQEMINSIRSRGVKTPVSVRTHPVKRNKWMLNYGARRYRGSLAAGRKTIPAFIDEAHDDYDQVIENIQRDDLKPMELALFIKKRLDAGEQKKTIAKNLGKDGATITQHLALIDSPACVEDAYSTGKCTSPKTLYELCGLYEKYPEQVETWCANAVEITRKMVADLANELKGKKDLAPNAGSEDESKFGHDQIYSGTSDGNHHNDFCTTDEGSSAKNKLTSKRGEDVSNPDVEADMGKDSGELTSWPKGRAVSDPDRMNKPLMLVEFNGRSAAVLLNRRPSTSGLIHIRFEDGSGDQEVDAAACRINILTEA